MEGAAVRVTVPHPHGPAISNAGGFYTLVDMPLAAQVDVEVSADGFTTLEDTITLDYAVVLNQHSFALESE